MLSCNLVPSFHTTPCSHNHTRQTAVLLAKPSHVVTAISGRQSKSSTSTSCSQRTWHACRSHGGSTMAQQATVQHTPSEAASISSYDGISDITEAYWDWKYSSRIRYIRAGSQGPPLLLVHGFGVGAYHYCNNIQELAKSYRVWALDLLGQGSSWPQRQITSEDGLCYSIDMWTDELQSFITEHIGEPTYLVGNSLGGFLSVSVAAQHPELVAGLVLLNATPFWSFRPPSDQPQGVWGLLGLDGGVPVPENLKQLVKATWWDNLSNPTTIRSMIQMVYRHKAAADEQLVERIVDATLHPAALDAFTSIVTAPKSRMDFDQMLAGVKCQIVMVYGREDPWVVPLWGQRLKRAVPSAVYLELTPTGHCPHHEAPAATNKAIGAWVAYMEGQRQQKQQKQKQQQTEQSSPHDSTGTSNSSSSSSTLQNSGAGEMPLQVGGCWDVAESCGRVVQVCHVDGSARNVFEKLDHALWQLKSR